MRHYSINVNGQLITFDQPKIMGIINVTPDSFYAQSRKQALEEIIYTAGQMITHGVTFIDVGGMSSRPGAKEISIQEEIDRVCPAIESILSTYPNAIISIDTYRSQVASAAITTGATIINDIAGGDLDQDILKIASKHETPYICMHMQGIPMHMQSNPTYEHVVQDVFKNLRIKIVRCREAGIKDVIVDLGFGFGKTIEHNFKLLKHMDYFQHLDCPILAGLSRKSMLYKPLDIQADDSLHATITAQTIALQKGANILRVHDVKEAMECVKIWELSNS